MRIFVDKHNTYGAIEADGKVFQTLVSDKFQLWPVMAQLEFTFKLEMSEMATAGHTTEEDIQTC